MKEHKSRCFILWYLFVFRKIFQALSFFCKAQHKMFIIPQKLNSNFFLFFKQYQRKFACFPELSIIFSEMNKPSRLNSVLMTLTANLPACLLLLLLSTL